MRSYILSFLIFSGAGQGLWAQTDSSVVQGIRSYTEGIDFLSGSNWPPSDRAESMTDGPMTQESTIISRNRQTKMPDTTLIKRSGVWSTRVLSNGKGDTVFRIRYHDNINQNFYLAFYYQGNALLYARLDYVEDITGHLLYKREEYYRGTRLAYTRETREEIDREYKRRTNINLYDKGMSYLRMAVIQPAKKQGGPDDRPGG